MQNQAIKDTTVEISQKPTSGEDNEEVDNGERKKSTAKVISPGLKNQRHIVKTVDSKGNITENAKDKAIEVKVVVEDFRFYFYLVFCLITFTGWILTTFYAKDFFGCDKYGNLLSDVFGSVNLCVVFDFPPATYILPSLYSVLVVFVYLYALAAIFRAWISKHENRITPLFFKLYSGAFVYFALSCSIFSTIFAVAPNPPEGKFTVLIHTMPYSNLIVALCCLQIAVTWFGIKVSWAHLNAPKWLRFCSILGLLGMIITTLFKVIQHTNALADIGECNPGIDWKEKVCNSQDSNPVHVCGKGWLWSVHEEETYKMMASVNEKAWVISTILFPTFQSGYFWFARFKTHYIICSIRDSIAAD